MALAGRTYSQILWISSCFGLAAGCFSLPLLALIGLLNLGADHQAIATPICFDLN